MGNTTPDIREGYKQTLQANTELNQGVKQTSIDVTASSHTTVTQGTPAQPRMVEVDVEAGGFFVAFVADENFLALTTDEQKTKPNWIFKTKQDGILFTDQDSIGQFNRVRISINKAHCGSALIWCEAFSHQPKNVIPHGFFVRASCTPRIVTATWRRFQQDNQGAVVSSSEELNYGDMLQLDIRTEGLNGDVVAVDFKEDETESILEHIAEPTFNGKLIINFPIKQVWRSQLFNMAERAFNDELVITPTITYRDTSGNEAKINAQKITIQNSVSSNPQEKGSVVPVSIGRVEIDPQQYDPCGFTALKIENSKRNYTHFEQGNPSAGGEIYEMVAGSSKKKSKITIKAEDLKTSHCHNQIDRHSDQEVTVTYFDADNYYKSETATIEGGDTVNHELICNLNENHLAPLHYIWPKREAISRRYTFYFDTCRFPRKELPVRVFSDIEWQLEFKWNHDAPFAYGFSEGLPSHSIDRNRAIGAALDGQHAAIDGEMMQSFGWSLKASWDGGDAIEIGDQFLESIRKTLGLFVKVKGLVDGITDQLKGSAPFTFEVKSPAIAAAASWKLKEMEEDTPDYVHQVATIVTVGASAKPLIGATFTLDLIALGANLFNPGVGKVVDFIRTEAKDYIEIKFEVRLYGDINAEGKIDINTLVLEETAGNIEVTGEIGVEVELSAKGSTGDIAGGSFKAELEAGITGKASVTGGIDAGADKDGIYVMPVAKFGGVIATFVLRGSVKFGIITKTFDQSPPEATIIAPDSVEFKKEDYYLNK